MDPQTDSGVLSAGSTSVTAGRWVALPGSGTGLVREDFLPAFCAAGLKDLNDFCTVRGEPLSKPGLADRYRARLTLPAAAGALTVYLKRFGREGWLARWRRRHEDGVDEDRGIREARIAIELVAAGIAVPEPLAWGTRIGPTRRQQQSFVVLAAVPGQPAQHWLGNAGSGPEAWKAKRQFVARLAALTRHFHQQGLRHRDFYLCHIFVHPMGSDLQLSIIDLQRVFRPRLRSRRWLIKDLAQLNYSALEFCSRSLRLRFALAYLGVNRVGPTERKLLCQIIGKTALIARHDQRRQLR